MLINDRILSKLKKFKTVEFSTSFICCETFQNSKNPFYTVGNTYLPNIILILYIKNAIRNSCFKKNSLKFNQIFEKFLAPIYS